jgi:molybdopterin-binding protein
VSPSPKPTGRARDTTAQYRAAQAADLLGVSADTIRRWADAGRLKSSLGADGKRYFEGVDLARVAVEANHSPSPQRPRAQSTRNRFIGIVTRVVKDKVVAQVEIQAGPHRVVSVITREAADELKLAPGVVVDAVIKATSVSVEIPDTF